MKHNNCPSNNFEHGPKSLSGNCHGDGHYKCKECKNFNNVHHLKTLREEKLFNVNINAY